jgi:hypothetical protein
VFTLIHSAVLFILFIEISPDVVARALFLLLLLLPRELPAQPYSPTALAAAATSREPATIAVEDDTEVDPIFSVGSRMIS